MHHMLNPNYDEPNLLSVLRSNGYLVWWGGKNDLVPGQLGYENHCDIKFSPTADDYARWGETPAEGSHGGNLAWRGEPQGDNFYSFFKGKLETPPDCKHFDGDWAMVYGALDFLRNCDGDQPVCLFLPIGYPHPPYCVEEPWYSLTCRDDIPERHTYATWEDKPALLRGIRDGQHLTDWTDERWRELRATYYGMCSRVDHQLGLLVDILKETNRYDDTALFVFSDHGDFTGDYGLVEKTQNTFQDCLSRVPFVFKPPHDLATNGGIREELMELVDFPATVYDLAGVDCGYWHFGRSLLPLLTGETDTHRNAVFTEGGRLRGEVQASERESMSSGSSLGLYSPRIRLQVEESATLKHTKATACRTQDFKYVRRAYELDEFYCLKIDPGETSNEINNPIYRGEILEHQERMLEWYMTTCDVVPTQPDQRNFSRA